MFYNVLLGDKLYRLVLDRDGEKWKGTLDEKSIEVTARLVRRDVLSIQIANRTYEIKRDSFNHQTRIWIENKPYIAVLRDPRSPRSGTPVGEKGTSSKMVASMPGKVLRVLVRPQERVEVGQALVVIEAMKMQNEIKSPIKGVVSRVVKEATQVNTGDVLASVEPEPPV